MKQSVLVRFPPRAGLSRPHGLRLGLSAKRELDASGLGRGLLDVDVEEAVEELEVFDDGARLRLRVPLGWLLRGSGSEQSSAIGRALSRRQRATAPATQTRPPHPSPGRPKALFFRSLLNSADKELGADHMYQGVFYIVSALKRAGLPFVLVGGRMSLEDGRVVTDPEALDRALREHPDVNFVGITLFDAYFEKARALIAYIKERSDAFVALGGSMPSQNPFETFAHLPQADFIVRGAGEEIVPRILQILGGSNARSGLTGRQWEELRQLDGLLAGQDGTLLLANADHVIRVEDMDRSPLDFSILERENVSGGTVLYLSRGCPYACFFCTSQDKARFKGKSARELARILGAYGRRLRETYGRLAAAPPQAFGIGFYDDDFLSGRDRAIELFDVFRRSPFHIQFFQTSVNSFFLRRRNEWTDELDEELLDAMPESLFLPKWGPPGSEAARPYVYIGMENYVDEELRRLGKPYRFERARTLVAALSARRIRQAHHFIVSNVQTTPEQIMENLSRIAALERDHGPFFSVLKPVISHLVSFYPSPSYKRMASLGLLDFVRLRQRLSLPGFQEFDYPLVDHDVPRDPAARELAGRMASWTSGSWQEALDAAAACMSGKGAAVACS